MVLIMVIKYIKFMLKILPVAFYASDSSSPILGPKGIWEHGKYVHNTAKSGEATHAELLGDIDGFNIGMRITNDPRKLLSHHIRDYYTAGNRFQEFKRHTNYELLKKQVELFMTWFRRMQELGLYEFKYKGCHHYKSFATLAETATNEFCARFSYELKDFGCP